MEVQVYDGSLVAADRAAPTVLLDQDLLDLLVPPCNRLS